MECGIGDEALVVTSPSVLMYITMLDIGFWSYESVLGPLGSFGKIKKFPQKQDFLIN